MKDYTATLQDNPPELIIDLYPNSGGTRTAKANRAVSRRGEGCQAGAPFGAQGKQESGAPTTGGSAAVAAGSRQPVSEDGVVDVARVVPDERSGVQPAAVEPQ